MFFPPELAEQAELESVEGEGPSGTTLELMRRIYFERQRGKADDALDRALVELVLDHARSVIAHPSRPTRRRLESFERGPHGDIALDESLEESPFLDSPETLLVELQEEKPFRAVFMLDSSSSMSGDKHLTASIAVAVLLLEVPPRDTGLSLFASRATEIKRLGVHEAPEETVLRFLRTQARGFTNIARGLDEGAAQFRRARGAGRKIGLIATDGRSTEGADPIQAARAFDFLVVLHLHGPGSHIDGSREMAQAGGGICLEVERMEDLPRRLYHALRMLARM